MPCQPVPGPSPRPMFFVLSGKTQAKPETGVDLEFIGANGGQLGRGPLAPSSSDILRGPPWSAAAKVPPFAGLPEANRVIRLLDSRPRAVSSQYVGSTARAVTLLLHSKERTYGPRLGERRPPLRRRMASPHAAGAITTRWRKANSCVGVRDRGIRRAARTEPRSPNSVSSEVKWKRNTPFLV